MNNKYTDWKYYNHSIISNLPPHMIPNFYVKVVNPSLFVEELFEVYSEAQKSYPSKNRNDIGIDEFSNYLEKIRLSNSDFFVATHKSTNKTVGYCVTPKYDEYFDLQSQKAIP